MPDPSDAFSTLDDFLLSLADGVAQAQTELGRASALGPPGQQYSYHLPRVDFELRMNLRVVQDNELATRYRDVRPQRPNAKHLLFKPLAAEEAGSTLEIAALVRGAFVAVPANQGLPGILLDTRVTLEDVAAPRVVVEARNTAGEPISGLMVQINLDREESSALSAASGPPLTLDAGTRFDSSVATTDTNGRASFVLRIGTAQRPGLLVLVIDAAGRTETLVYEVKA